MEPDVISFLTSIERADDNRNLIAGMEAAQDTLHFDRVMNYLTIDRNELVSQLYALIAKIPGCIRPCWDDTVKHQGVLIKCAEEGDAHPPIGKEKCRDKNCDRHELIDERYDLKGLIDMDI